MDGAMGLEEEVVEAVLTCEGDFHDPELLSHVERFKQKLRDLLLTDESKLNVKKIEPWNSVKVTFTIPKEAALRLRQLAQSGNAALKEMGVLSVQIQGDSSISLTIAGRNNETTEIMLRPSAGISGTSSSIPFTSREAAEPSSSSDVPPFPGLSNEEVTRKNIVDYLTQGPSRRQNPSIFDSILGVGTPSGTTSVPESAGGGPLSPKLFPGQMASGLPIRQGHMPAMATLPNSTMRGPQINNFPLSKGNGAFHVPLPNPSSGQGPSGPYAQRMNSSIAKNSPNQPSPLGMPPGSQQQKNIPGGMNTFGPVGLRLPPSLTIPVNNALPPPSSSPGIMMDLPPPPPYPHSSANNAQRPGKQVSASSPLLVNLLQTDPLAVTAGVASGNPNKAISAGDSTSVPPSKKKRSKKSKEGMSKSSLPSDILSSNREILGPSSNVFNPIDVNENPRTSAAPARSDITSISLSKFNRESLPGGAIDSRIGLPVSHIAESVHEDKHFKPLVTSDRPYNESAFERSSSTFSNLGTYNSSAIGTGNHKSIGLNGRDSSQEASDLFSLEIAAGKIINPYTGQLEPRDSILESSGGRMREYSFQSQGRNALPVAMGRRDVGNSSLKHVPVSVSQLVDINVLRTCPPVSSSTAAFVHSGPPSQISSDRLPSNLPPHRRNVTTSDNIDGPMDIYAARLNSKVEAEHNFTPVVSAITQSFNSQHQSRQIVSSSQNVQRTTGSSLHASGESFLSQALPMHHKMPQTVHNALPPHSMPIPSHASRVSATLSGSVITSELTHSSFPASHESNLVQSQSNSVLFHPASCASSTARSPSSPYVSSLNSFPSSSVQTPSLSSSAQSVTHVPERFKSVDSSTSISHQHLQAATSEATGGTSVKSSFPNLLNPPPDKPSESSKNMERSPPDKISFEGDDNSNHSGMVVENQTESSGTSVLLEHSGVKAENHDSGVGSSSERSDDTPSEPGDGEFRSNSNGTEAEDAGGKAAKRLVNCKTESGIDSSTSNTITVGYITSVDCGSQPNLINSKDAMEVMRSKSGSLPPVLQDPKSDNFYDSHVQSIQKSFERTPSNHAMSSMSWVVEMNKNQSVPPRGKAKMNGPLLEEKDLSGKMLNPEIKLNGPNSEIEIGKMFIAMDDLQDQHRDHLKLCGTMKDNLPEHLKLKDEDLDEIIKLNHATLSPELGIGKTGLLEKEDSPDHLSHSLNSSDDRLEHFNFLDMEDLVNGKLLSNGTMVGDNKTGANITSIYSKRSSPVNVNMLNHIYAPGLPLPRRLTESVQRLVKPLPASETSVPQARHCKSPGMVSPRAMGTVNGPSASRMSLHSGTRSPGASVPKLIPSDKHSLLSGGLDLAGLSSVSYHQAFQASDLNLGSSSISMKASSLGVLPDLPACDSQLFSSSGPMSIDSVVHAHKILSQSYPPHKSRDLASNAALYDLFSHTQPSSLSGESFSLSSSAHNIDPISKTNCDSGVSPPISKSPKWNSANRQLTSKEGALLNHTPVTSSHSSSNSNSVSLPSSDSLPRFEDSSSHSRNLFFDVSSSSPEHSNTFPPSVSVLQTKDFTDHVANSTIQSNQSVSTAGMSASWSKISLTNGGSSAAKSGHLTSPSTSRHVPYLAHSSSVVTSSLDSSKVATSISNSLFPSPKTNEMGNNVIASPDNTLPLRTSGKTDLSSPRAGASSSSLRRNLFESVSGELGSIQPVSSHASLCRTLGSTTIPPHPNSVLETNQGFKALEKTFPAPAHNESLDLQSIRTNETPSTSLPAQVVHLDFPHYTSPTTSLCATGIQPELPKTSLSSTTNIPTIQPHATLSNSSWALPGTTSTSFLSLSTKSNTLPTSTLESSTIVSPAKAIASIVSSQSETFSSHTVNERLNTHNTAMKEPILETLASTLDPAFNKGESSPPHSEFSEKTLNTVSSTTIKFPSKLPSYESSKKPWQVPQDTPTDQEIDKRGESRQDQQNVESVQEGPAGKGAKKRTLSASNNEHKDVGIVADSPPEKRQHLELTPSVSKSDLSSGTGDSQNEPIESQSESNVSEMDPANKSDTNLEESRFSGYDDKSMKTNENVQNLSLVPEDISTILPKPILSSISDSNRKESVMTTATEHVKDSLSIEEKDSYVEPAEIPTVKDPNVASSLRPLEDEKSENKTVTALAEVKRGDGEVQAVSKKVISGKVGESTVTEIMSLKETNDEAKEEALSNTTSMPTTPKFANPESKLDDSTKKGRVRRQFYAYVPEKSIDQTYFDTPILSGRTRSRNKPAETSLTEVASSQDSGMSVASDTPAVNSSGVIAKGDSSQENVAGKRSTRSLRTKDATPDANSSKRRRIQSRDNR